MRRGFDDLALLVQEVLKHNPHYGHLFVFRSKRGGLIKVLWHDGQGMCLLAERQAHRAEVRDQALLIEKLEHQIAQLRHEPFGQSSARRALLDRLELQLFELKED